MYLKSARTCYGNKQPGTVVEPPSKKEEKLLILHGFRECDKDGRLLEPVEVQPETVTVSRGEFEARMKATRAEVEAELRDELYEEHAEELDRLGAVITDLKAQLDKHDPEPVKTGPVKLQQPANVKTPGARKS